MLVERRLAERFSLAVGDTLALAGPLSPLRCLAVVAGVYEPEADPSELARERPRVIMHLPDVALLAGREDEVDRFSVRLRTLPADADTVGESGLAGDELPSGTLRRRLESLLPGTRVLGASAVADRASTTFEVVRRFHRAIGLITITAGGVFLACIMTLKVQERRTQVAALRLVGVSRRTLLAWLMLEAAFVSAAGGAMGVGIGHLASAIINAYYQSAYETTLAFSIVTPDTVRTGLVLAVVLGLVAGGVAALRLLQVDALEEVGR